jgi:PAS domain S-box-containing protein
MPRMNGLDMLEEIRQLDYEIPAILTTAHDETNFLMKAIKVNVSYYALKPINTPILLENVQKFCMMNHQQNLIVKKEKELSSYIDIIDQVATITKIDHDGTLLNVNELFCDISLYDKDEIIGKSIKEVTHKDILTTVYLSMEETIHKGQNWEGLYKSIDKDGNHFYLRISAIPDFDDDTNQMTQCTFVGFITTEDEQDKRDTMQKVRQNIIEQRKKESQLNKKIEHLENITKHKGDSIEIDFLQTSLQKYKERNTTLLNQTKHYEKDISFLKNKLSNIIEAEMTKRHDLMERNKILQITNKSLRESVIHLQNKLKEPGGSKK